MKIIWTILHILYPDLSPNQQGFEMYFDIIIIILK